MDSENLVVTKTSSSLKFSDRSSSINFNFITDDEVNKTMRDHCEKLAHTGEGDTNVKSAIFESVSIIDFLSVLVN